MDFTHRKCQILKVEHPKDKVRLGHRLVYCKNAEDIGLSAASYIHSIYKTKVSEKSQFTLVLSGGKTPEVLYRTLASPEFNNRIQWNRVKVFWGDERFVPKNDPESNFGMAHRTLLSKVTLPEENVYPIPTEADTAIEAADTYENTLRTFFQQSGSITGSPPMPVFDLILLGLGKDGHAASLFPGNSIDPQGSRWVEAVAAPPFYPTRERITLTLPVLNSSANIVFLVSGSDKKETLEQVLKGRTHNEEMLPAQLVQTVSDIVWFTDIDMGGL